MRYLKISVNLAMVANDYTVAIVNTNVGSHIVANVFHVSKKVDHKFVGGGVCLFFDKYEDLIEVIASDDDIIYDSDNYRPKNAEYLCLLGDENIMSVDEVVELFDGIREGHIQIISTVAEKIRITMSKN